jgi:hypothetical protein
MNKNNHAMFSEMKNNKKKTIWLLTEYPDTRDCDNLLYCYFVIHSIHKSGKKVMGMEKLKGMTALEYLTHVKNHGIVNYGSLIRGRRLIQANEQYKHLRGTKGDDRDKGDDYWRNNINKPD